MGELLAVGHGFKSVRGPVFRQQRLQRNVDAKQVMQRVLVFHPGEPAAADTAAGCDVLGVRLEQRGLEGGEKGILHGLFRLWLPFGRHLAVAHAFEDLLPGLEAGGILQVEGQVCQVEPALFHVGVMALGAVLVEKGGGCFCSGPVDAGCEEGDVGQATKHGGGLEAFGIDGCGGRQGACGLVQPEAKHFHRLRGLLIRL